MSSKAKKVTLKGNGFEYKGQVKDGKPHGNGKMKDEDGVFQGTFANGEKVKGALFYKDGSIYDGEWDENVFHGKGKYFENGKIILDGLFKHEMFYKGKRYYRDRTVYEGEYEDEQPQGHGVIVYPHGKKYEGEFDEGLIVGPGKVTFPSGKTLTCDQFNSKGYPIGICHVTYPNGTKETRTYHSTRKSYKTHRNSSNSNRKSSKSSNRNSLN